MRGIVLSTLCALYLYGNSGDPQAIIKEVANLRQKYEECAREQKNLSSVDVASKISGYQKRIAHLEAQLELTGKELSRLKKHTTEIEREITQKKGVIQSLEKTLRARDKSYREASEENERLLAQTNSAKVSKIERQSLTASLEKTKFEVERLENIVAKTSKERIRLEQELAVARGQVDKYKNTKIPESKIPEAPKTLVTSDQSGKIKALQNELTRANAYILKLQNTQATPAVQEKIVTKIVEPTEKLVALQRELSAAQATIATLKKGSKVITQEKIVEKIVYKDRPAVQEKVVTKVVESTEKIAALQRELANTQAKLTNLKNNPSNTIVKEKIVEKIVYKDRPVIQEKIVEKIVYKDRPVVQEKVVYKASDATEKLNRALQERLAESEAQMEKMKAKSAKLAPPKTTKINAQSVAVPEKMSKVLKAPETKALTTASNTSSAKKSAPSAYRMATNAPVYNTPGGSVVDTWEERRSFTSGTVSNGWIKITGYFVNRVWQRADQELWVKESDVIRR
jgi:chromosome segregation ATPase